MIKVTDRQDGNIIYINEDHIESIIDNTHGADIFVPDGPAPYQVAESAQFVCELIRIEQKRRNNK